MLNVREAIDGVRVNDLVEQYGSPLFVYSEQAIRFQYRQMHKAFATRYPNVEFAWSYKTNYLKAICSLMHQEGAIAEIVSRMEYEKAKALAVPGKQIVFNGPYKPFETLLTAVGEGATVNVDHFAEIDDLDKVAARLDRKIAVGIRLNLDCGIRPQWSRFGFNLESGQASDAVKRIYKNGMLELNGLHCHLGTSILDVSAYGKAIEKLVKFGYQMRTEHRSEIESIDIGGGFASRSDSKSIHRSPDVKLPSHDEYAHAICERLLDALEPGHRPKLVVESGRALIDEAGYLITSILAIKRLADGTRAYIADAGINLLLMSLWYKFNVELDREVVGDKQLSAVYGPMCMNIDVVDEGILLPSLQRGQRLILSPVGAYNNTQWLQFIEYRPNVVMVCDDGTVELIREAEDLSDIERRERLPAKLACVKS